MVNSLDWTVFRALHSSNCEPTLWAQFNEFVTKEFFHIWLLTLVVVFWPKGKAGVYPALMSLYSNLVAWVVVGYYLKPLFGRPRPFVEFPDICVIGDKLSSHAFPSGHAMESAAVAAAIWFFNPGRPLVRAFVVILALFVGYTRLYTGVHYPSDVVAGWVLGWVLGWGWYHLTEWARKKSPA